VRIGEINVATFHTVRRRFFADIAANNLHIVMLTNKHGRSAVKLLVKHAPKRALRTLDALQLVIAIYLKSQKSLDYFVCADDKLGKIAKLEKIAFLNPELP
jgi:hypothetical protein